MFETSKRHVLTIAACIGIAGPVIAGGGGDPCDGFAGPFPPCAGRIVPGASVCSASFYPNGVAPFYPGIFPLIQVCGPDCEPCLFPPLTMDVKIYPRVANDFVCDVTPLAFPFGTVFAPDIVNTDPFPTGDCPFELAIVLPPAAVVCPGNLDHTVTLETRSEWIQQGPGGGSTFTDTVGFLLICMKEQEEAAARSLGIIPIVGSSTVLDDDMIVAAPFAVANPTGLDAELNLTAFSSDWQIVSELPPVLPLGAGESATLVVEVQMPAGTAIGTSNEVVLTVDLNGDPATTASEPVELIVIEPPLVEPACIADCAPAHDDGTFGDTVVDVSDVLAVLGSWGEGGGPCDIAPAGGDGQVDVSDLLVVLAGYGPCR